MKPFFVYILRCSDNSYYVGHTDDIEKRVSQHKIGKGCGYTSTRLPVQVVHVSPVASRYEALCAEHKIKRWTRKKKEALIDGNWKLLSFLAKKNFDKRSKK